ncbi:MAG: hypothetical protein QOE79_383 [Sphingomonadales bacterium]|nr:hypothetical protein [Sphingomonadales bacterium]MEA3048499.1 hypothetical protein [Sphingomonadales bacterium]
MKQALVLGAVAALVMAAASPESTAPDATARTSAYSTKKICREEGTLGSRLENHRICRTKAEWDQIKAESRRVTERIEAGPSACVPPRVC